MTLYCHLLIKYTGADESQLEEGSTIGNQIKPLADKNHHCHSDVIQFRKKHVSYCIVI